MSASERRAWTIDVFDDATERLVEEHKLVGLTVEKLREIFRQPDTEPMVDSFRVSETEARALQLYLSKPLQWASGRSYFLECHSED